MLLLDYYANNTTTNAIAASEDTNEWNFYTLPNAQEIFEFMKLYNFKLLEEFDKNSSYTNYHFVKIS